MLDFYFCFVKLKSVLSQVREGDNGNKLFKRRQENVSSNEKEEREYYYRGEYRG